MADVETSTTESALPDENNTGAPESESPADDDFSLEDVRSFLRRAASFYKQHEHLILAAALLCVVVVISLSALLKNNDLPLVKEFAENSLKRGIMPQLLQKYSNLPQKEQNVYAAAEFEKIKKNADYRNSLKGVEKMIQDGVRDPAGIPHFFDADSYLWFYKSSNVVTYGHVGNEKREKDGRLWSYDTLLLAPVGDFVAPNLFPYLVAYAYLFLSFFSSLTLKAVLFYSSVFFGVLAVIIVFLVIWRRTESSIAAFAGALLLGINHRFIERSQVGVADTDGLSILFPLLLFLLLSELENSTLKLKKALLLGTGAGVLMAAYALTWGGWWVFFNAFLLVIPAYFGYRVLRALRAKERLALFVRDTSVVHHLFFFLLLFLVSFGLIVVFLDASYFFRAPLVFIKTLGDFGTATGVSSGLWPNVYLTVSELRDASLAKILGSIGGTAMFVFALLGILLYFGKKAYASRQQTIRTLFAVVLTGLYYALVLSTTSFFSKKTFILLLGMPLVFLVVWSLKKKRGCVVAGGAFLAFWLIGMLYVSFQAVRFIYVLMPAVALGTGFFVAWLQSYLPRFGRWLNLPQRIFPVIFFVIILLMVTMPESSNAARGIMPLFFDTWTNTLLSIESETASDAIVVAWWDWGQTIKAMANRRVIFDGGTQNRPQAHWVARVLFTTDENEAVGILRMLACNGNSAYEHLNAELNDQVKTTSLLSRAVAAGKKTGLTLLRAASVSNETVLLLEKDLYCQPPETYLIVSSEILDKVTPINMIGSWDFEKAQIWKKTRGMSYPDIILYLTDTMNYTPENASNIADQMERVHNDHDASIEFISSFIAVSPLTQCGEKPPIAACTGSGVEVRLNMETEEVNVTGLSPDNELGFAAWNQDGQVKTRAYPRTQEDERNQVAIVFKTGEMPMVYLANPPFERSMLVRLLLFEGLDTPHFSQVYKQVAMFQPVVITYKVVWEPAMVSK